MPDEPGLNSSPETAPSSSVATPQRMRKTLWWVLAGGVVLLVLTGSSCVGCVMVGSRASKKGAAFAAETIQQVAGPWNADRLLAVASPEFLQTMPREKVPLFVSFISRRLGTVTKVGEIQDGPWRVYVGSTGPAVFTWHYSDCEFERGPARVTLQLVRRAGKWQVAGLFLNSDLLMQDRVNQ